METNMLEQYYNEVFKQEFDPEFDLLTDEQIKVLTKSNGFALYRLSKACEAYAISTKRALEDIQYFTNRITKKISENMISIKKKHFRLRVQSLSTPEDFENYKDLLLKIDEWLYDAFCNCLKLGSTIYQAYIIVRKADDIARELALSPDQIVAMIPAFRVLILILDGEIKPNGA